MMSQQNQNIENYNSRTLTQEQILSGLTEIKNILPPKIQLKISNPLQKIQHYLTNQIQNSFDGNIQEQNIELQEHIEETNKALQSIRMNINQKEKLEKLSNILIPILFKSQFVVYKLNQQQKSLNSSTLEIKQEIENFHNLIKDESLNLLAIPLQYQPQPSLDSSSELLIIEQTIMDLIFEKNNLQKKIFDLENSNKSSDKVLQTQTPIKNITIHVADNSKQERNNLKSSPQQYSQQLDQAKFNFLFYDPYVDQSKLQYISDLTKYNIFQFFNILDIKKQNTILKQTCFYSKKQQKLKEYLQKIQAFLQQQSQNPVKNYLIALLLNTDDSKDEYNTLPHDIFQFVINIKKLNFKVELNFIQQPNHQLTQFAIKEINGMNQPSIIANTIQLEKLYELFCMPQQSLQHINNPKNTAILQIQERQDRTLKNLDKKIINNQQAQLLNLINIKQFQQQQDIDRDKQQQLLDLCQQLEKKELSLELEKQKQKEKKNQLEIQQELQQLAIQNEVNTIIITNQETQKRLDLIKQYVGQITIIDEQEVQNKYQQIFDHLQKLQQDILNLQICMFSQENIVLFTKYALDANITSLNPSIANIYDLVCEHIFQQTLQQEYKQILSTITLQQFNQPSIQEFRQQFSHFDQNLLDFLGNIYQHFDSSNLISFCQKSIQTNKIESCVLLNMIQDIQDLQFKLSHNSK